MFDIYMYDEVSTVFTFKRSDEWQHVISVGVREDYVQEGGKGRKGLGNSRSTACSRSSTVVMIRSNGTTAAVTCIGWAIALEERGFVGQERLRNVSGQEGLER